MKAKYFMVGFIVNTPIGIGKVVQIYDNGASVEVDGEWNNYYYSELSFAEITKEILEKNGIKWLSTEPSGRITYISIEPPIIATWLKDHWLVSVGPAGSTKMPYVEIGWLNYVHQLQCALRLCGIEKEITI